jgi:ABC-type lipoprotein export system ATPase subunit
MAADLDPAATAPPHQPFDVVVVTHNRMMAEQMSRRIELEDGRIIHRE